MSDGLGPIDILFGERRDLGGWKRRHEAGEVPGRWPYGLDELADLGLDVRAINVRSPGIVRRVGARAGLTRRRSNFGRIGVTWDENVATAMAALGEYRLMLSGVIWATDVDAARRSEAAQVLRRLDGVWVNSRAQLQPLERLAGPGGPRAEFFRFGVDAEFYTPAALPDQPLVFSAGGDRDRDPTTLYTALEIVRSVRPDAAMVVQTRSELAPPAGVVRFAHVSHRDLRDWYRRASVVAIATRPNLHLSGLTVSLESMATGRPVVVTAGPGIEDYLTDGENALLVQQGDPEALAANILRALGDRTLARSLGARGRDFVERAATTKHLCEALARFVRRVADDAGARGARR